MPYSTPRRSGRLHQELPILLMGSDSEGRVFSEESKTVVLSYHGAGIISRNKLVPEQILSLRCLGTGRETEVRVVGAIDVENPVHTYGVAFLDPCLDFWEIEFPPPPSNAEPSRTVDILCSGCSTPAEIENGSFEFDVCMIHGGLVRFCDSCGFATVWRISTQIMPPRPRPKPAPPAPAEAPVPRASHATDPELLTSESRVALLELAMPKPRASRAGAPLRSEASPLCQVLADFTPVEQANRRQHVRAKVNYYACVRSDEFGTDIVACNDMSRGGLSFRTSNLYPLGVIVDIAVPFSRETPQAPAIFVPARIVSLRPISNSDLLRCGVAFLPRR